MSGATHTAVVSGLGPNGVAAALELLAMGFEVTVVEKRPFYTRPIHLHLRSTYLEDIKRLSPSLHQKLMDIATPIVENLRQTTLDHDLMPNHMQDRRARPRDGEPCPVWLRLSTPPERHVRLDNAERLFYQHLKELAAEPGSKLTIRRGCTLRLEPGESESFKVLLKNARTQKTEDLGVPDLVVIAEGGKSTTVRDLGLESVRFSYPKYFMSAHVAMPFGPRTRRIDTDVRALVDDPAAGQAEVSLWASGHGDADEGTWVVIEVPETLLHQRPEQAEEYFVKGAMLLMNQPRVELLEQETENKIRASLGEGAILSRKRGAVVPSMDSAGKSPFAGTFKFEQQCLKYPAAGNNMVVLGDAAGMGHHALSSGLEIGAFDLLALRRLGTALLEREDGAKAVSDYAEEVFESRLKLLSLGMNEYYPNDATGRLKMLQKAAELWAEEQD